MTIAAILRGKGSDVETIASGARCRRGAPARRAQDRRAARGRGDAIAGIMSERDVIYCLRTMAPRSSTGRSPGDDRRRPSRSIVDTEVLSALALMTQRRIRHLPVVEGGEIIGIVSIGDLVKYRIDRIEAEAEAMRDLYPERLSRRISRKSRFPPIWIRAFLKRSEDPI